MCIISIPFLTPFYKTIKYFSSGLKKDSAAETFRLRYRTPEGLYLPIQYVKIVPLQSWGPAYNYTIWYVELTGKNQEEFIANAMETIGLVSLS